MVVILALAVIGYLAYNNQTSGVFTKAASTFTFDQFEFEDYTISQLVIDPKTPSAVAEFTANSDIKTPLKITVSFYDSANKRVGAATCLTKIALAKNQTTTISFNFIEATDLKAMKSARIEIVEASI